MTGRIPPRRLGRREFLAGSALAGAGAAGGGAFVLAREFWGEADSASAGDAALAESAGEFVLTDAHVDLTTFLLAPHPRAVREAIEEHRRNLDANPKGYLFAREGELEQGVLEAAGRYLGVEPGSIALTDSTTMGLGLVYGTLRLRAGEEVVTTEHDHYATHESLRLRAERTGASVRRIRLFAELASVTAEEIVESVLAEIRPGTRVVALTWVHSSTGLKLPVPAIANALADANAGREPEERVLLCVDGVHGLGVEETAVAELGCDVFVSGCHKWLFGPRGTGFVWASEEAWGRVAPVIPTFDPRSYDAWIRGEPPSDLPPAAAMTPGGFHSFEHRWALAQAFELHERVGRSRVAAHTHGLARALKEGLDALPSVALVTPLEDDLSSGIVCVDVENLPAAEAVDRLGEDGVIASVTPYAEQHVRFGPSVANSAADVDRALDAVARLV